MTDHVDDVLERIRAAGGRVTPARRAVLAAVLDAGTHHFTVADIVAAVEDTRSRVDRATVYRTLDLLVDIGILKPLQLDGDAVVYHRTDHRHAHLLCAECGAIEEIPPRPLAAFVQSLDRQKGYLVDSDAVAIIGLCGPCRARAG